MMPCAGDGYFLYARQFCLLGCICVYLGHWFIASLYHFVSVEAEKAKLPQDLNFHVCTFSEMLMPVRLEPELG